MDTRLFPGLEYRFVFVVGKGGVGKTTCAGALSLAAADAGIPTLLLSTDPAHSVGDLFGMALGNAPHRGVCGSPLTLEEFDSHAYARGWLAEHGAALADLIDRGTYLGPDESRALLEPVLPGVDEVMAALRLAELADEAGHARIVVDTAPTGHALRLLDAGSTVRSWLVALRAMARKAAAVAAALTRREVRFAADDLIYQLEDRIRRFEEDVLACSAFLPVSRPDQLVLAETARLRAELERRGLEVVAELRIGAEQAADGIRPVPFGPGISGCSGLRALAGMGTWPAHASPTPPAGRNRSRPGGEAEAVSPGAERRLVAGRRVIVFAGKGGVGKTTCAAALATALATRRDVRLYGIDPAGSLEDVLGLSLAAEGEFVQDRLFVRQVDSVAELDRLRFEYRDCVEAFFAGNKLVGAADLDRSVIESLSNLSPPGIDELAALALLMEWTGYSAPNDSEPGQDSAPVTIIDAAPTGHFLRLLELPGTALDWVHALMRILLANSAAIDLDVAGEPLLRLSKRLRTLILALSDARWTGAAVVTLPEPLVAAETRRLRDQLRRAGVPLAAVICNRAAPGADCGAAGSVLAIRSPELDSSPRGLNALRSFFDLWQWPPGDPAR